MIQQKPVFILLFMLFTVFALVSCQEPQPEVTLDFANQTVNELDINQYFSFRAHGPTINILHFQEQNAVVVINFPNESPELTLNGTVNIFDASETAESIDQWINNLHSDALYPDVPEPIHTSSLAGYTILSSSLIDQETGPNGDEYDVYGVEYRLDEVADAGVFTLNELENLTVVYVMTKDVEEQ